MELIGRKTEIAAVEQAIADVRDGASRVLVVVGEPGIGKTALLEAAAERAAAAGLLTLQGRAAEHEREVPFALAVAMFDDHVATMHPKRIEALGPVLGAVLPAAAGGVAPVPATDAAAERFRYHRALRALIELLARERPTALILDDLHWADDASLEFIQHVLRRPPRAPHLLVLALRPGPLAGALTMPVTGVVNIHLEPLDDDESLALVAGVRDRRARERIARDAGGNPFFLSQLARFPDDRLPPCVLAAVSQEIGLLGDAERVLLEGAAVAGDPVRPGARGGRRPSAPPTSTGWSPSGSCGRRGAGGRSRSGIRSCGAPSTTRRRPPGGSARMSGSRRRCARGARRRACARTTSSGSRGPGTRTRSAC